jgi:subtilisin
MAPTNPTQQYVILPPRGLRAVGPGASAGLRSFLTSAQLGPCEFGAGGRQARIEILDSIADDGAKLIAATPQAALELRAAQPSLRVVPVLRYCSAVTQRRELRTTSTASAAGGPLTLRVVSEIDRAPVPGAYVIAYVNLASGEGAQAITDADGNAMLQLGEPSVPIERLYVYPTTACWTLRKDAVTLTDGGEVAVRPLDLSYTDCVRYYYGHAPDDAGAGVSVGVVDTGIATHPDLVIDGGLNSVTGEDDADIGDNGNGHGTHVAGIVAARGTPPAGIRGVAPGVKLRSYRVFGRGQPQAENFAIAKGIAQAVEDGCDIISLAMSGVAPDAIISTAIEDARAGGSIVIASAGSDGRGPIGQPAADELAVAVGALGRLGTFPDDAAESDDIAAPFGTDEAEFIGGFSNVGRQLDFVGPGVAVMSTYPGGYTEISGTAMAVPAVAGVAARLLQGAPETLAATRDAARSEAILALLIASASDRGFPDTFEGHGLPILPT